MYGSLNKSKELYPNIIHTNWTYTCSKSEAWYFWSEIPPPGSAISVHKDRPRQPSQTQSYLKYTFDQDSSSWFSNQCPRRPSKTTFPDSNLLEWTIARWTTINCPHLFGTFFEEGISIRTITTHTHTHTNEQVKGESGRKAYCNQTAETIQCIPGSPQNCEQKSKIRNQIMK